MADYLNSEDIIYRIRVAIEIAGYGTVRLTLRILDTSASPPIDFS